MNELSKSDWAALYQAAITFKQTSPWGGCQTKTFLPLKAPTISKVTAEPIGALNEATLQLLRSRGGGLSGCWELDIFVLPIPIGNASGRPYFPICFLAVDRELGLIVDSNLTEPWLTLAEKRNGVTKILEKTDQLPQEIWVKSQRVKGIMKPIADALGIRLRVRSLRLLEEARTSLYSHLSRGNL